MERHNFIVFKDNFRVLADKGFTIHMEGISKNIIYLEKGMETSFYEVREMLIFMESKNLDFPNFISSHGSLKLVRLNGVDYYVPFRRARDSQRRNFYEWGISKSPYTNVSGVIVAKDFAAQEKLYKKYFMERYGDEF